MTPPTSACRFPHGSVLLTSGIVDLALAGHLDLPTLLGRHLRGDWGSASPARQELNEAGVRSGGELVSRYLVRGEQQVIIATNPDRSRTSVMLLVEFGADITDLTHLR